MLPLSEKYLLFQYKRAWFVTFMWISQKIFYFYVYGFTTILKSLTDKKNFLKIKAAVVNKMEDSFEIEDNIDFHEVGPTDLQILMVASKICHSDETLAQQ